MMDRRALISGLATVAIASGKPAIAQSRTRPVVGFLNTQSPVAWQRLLAAFQRGLKEHGFADGENVTIEYRWAEGRNDRLPALAAELVARKVQVIVTTGGPDPALAAKGATSEIPIVFVSGVDPAKAGLIDTLARPSGNLTGFTLFTSLLGPKRLEILNELVPGTGPIAVLFNQDNSSSQLQLRELETAAARLGVRIAGYSAGTASEIATAFSAIAAAKSRSLFVTSESNYFAQPAVLTDLAAKHAIPAIYEARLFADAGGLISYGTDFTDIYRRAGIYTARILKGDKVADLPVEQPTKFETVLNLKTAKALGLTVPTTLLARADEVIE